MLKFIVKTFLTSIIGLILGYFTFKKTMELNHPYISSLSNGIKKESKIDVFFFGSSVDNYFDSLDFDKTSISERIQKKTSLNVSGISRKANNNKLHQIFFQRIIEKNKNTNLKYVIIPINLRSYSPEWDLRPEYQFKNISTYYDWKSFFKNPKTKYTSYNYKVLFNGKYYSLSNKNNRSLKNDFIYKYLYDLNDNNSTLKSLKDILTYEEKNIVKVFYFTPIDVEKGNELIGNFNCYLNKNIQFIKELLSEEIYIDLTHELNSESFSYPRYKSLNNFEEGSVNEHLNEKGKEFVSDTLSLLILSIKNNY